MENRLSSSRFFPGQKVLQDRNIEPEDFEDRIIFMSMFNEIEWIKKGIQNNVCQIPKKSRSMRRDSRKGHWTFLGLRDEKKWYGTLSCTPEGKWDSTVAQMVEWFKDTGHLRFVWSSRFPLGHQGFPWAHDVDQFETFLPAMKMTTQSALYAPGRRRLHSASLNLRLVVVALQSISWRTTPSEGTLSRLPQRGRSLWMSQRNCLFGINYDTEITVGVKRSFDAEVLSFQHYGDAQDKQRMQYLLHPGQNGRRTNFFLDKNQSLNVQIFGYIYQSTNGPNHGSLWKTRFFFLNGICTVIFLAGLLWERQLEKVLINIRLWERQFEEASLDLWMGESAELGMYVRYAKWYGYYRKRCWTTTCSRSTILYNLQFKEVGILFSGIETWHNEAARKNIVKWNENRWIRQFLHLASKVDVQCWIILVELILTMVWWIIREFLFRNGILEFFLTLWNYKAGKSTSELRFV